MGYFQVSYDSRVVIYFCKLFIRLDTGIIDFSDSQIRHDVHLLDSGMLQDVCNEVIGNILFIHFLIPIKLLLPYLISAPKYSTLELVYLFYP